MTQGGRNEEKEIEGMRERVGEVLIETSATVESPAKREERGGVRCSSPNKHIS